MSRKFSVDKNHNPIVAELQQRGLTVEDLASLGKGLPDIVVHKKKR